MKSKKPASIIVLIIVLAITIITLITSVLFSRYQVDIKYAIYLGILMIIALSLMTVGIFAGMRFKSDQHRPTNLNRIGLFGNLFMLLFTIGLMVYATYGHFNPN
jgi:hypothetical protein